MVGSFYQYLLIIQIWWPFCFVPIQLESKQIITIWTYHTTWGQLLQPWINFDPHSSQVVIFFDFDMHMSWGIIHLWYRDVEASCHSIQIEASFHSPWYPCLLRHHSIALGIHVYWCITPLPLVSMFIDASLHCPWYPCLLRHHSIALGIHVYWGITPLPLVSMFIEASFHFPWYPILLRHYSTALGIQMYWGIIPLPLVYYVWRHSTALNIDVLRHHPTALGLHTY